jgi:hypothetical protein
MEITGSSEMLVMKYQTARHHIAEESTHCCENLKYQEFCYPFRTSAKLSPGSSRLFGGADIRTTLTKSAWSGKVGSMPEQDASAT